MIIAPAERLSQIGEYYFSKKMDAIRSMQLSGLKVVNLGMGSPDLTPAQEVLQTTVQAVQNPKNHGYPSYRSSPELRRAMAQFYERVYGVHLNPDKEVLPLLGSKEGILHVSLAFVNPGDKVLIPNPGYPAYTSVAALLGAKICYYDLLEKNNWQPDWAALEAMDLTGAKLMWMNYPHMPTGASASDELFTKAVAFARKKKLMICHDNPYGLVLNVEAPKSILKFDPQHEVTLELNSLSKSFNMAGWRIGMMMASEQVVDTVLQVKSNADTGMFLALQQGAVTALGLSKEWHDARNETYRQRREVIWQIFDLLGFKYNRKDVGLFVWAKAPDHIPDLVQYLDRLLDKALVFMTPGFVFGSNGERYARASLCVPVDLLQEALARIQLLGPQLGGK